MQCYTRSDDYFGETERFVRVQSRAGNIDHGQLKQARAQLNLNTISGKNGMLWANDYNFVRTAAVVLRMLMLRATKIHEEHDEKWTKGLVSTNSVAFVHNKDEIHAEGQREMPCPAANLVEAADIVACYDTQFASKKMMQQIKGMAPNETRFFTEMMAVVKPAPGGDDIKLWFIITTWRIRILQEGEYEAVPFVAVIYVKGNRQARADWRQGQRQDVLQLEQLMENLRIDGNLRQAIRENLADPQPAQNAA